MTDVSHLIGLPVIHNPWVPKGNVYLLYNRLVVIGTWVKPLQSVAAIITMQRRRRGY